MSELIVNEHKYESVFEFLIRILIDLLHRAHNLHKEVKIENREKTRPSLLCMAHEMSHEKRKYSFDRIHLSY